MDLDPADLVALLAAAPGTKENKQAFFEERYHTRVARTNYDVMWERLSDELGEARGANAVLQYVAETAEQRVLRLVHLASDGCDVEFRVREPVILDVLFEDGDELSDVGIALSHLLRPDRREARRPAVRKPPTAPAEAPPPASVAPEPARRARPIGESVGSADVVLCWHGADPKDTRHGPWQWSKCLYAYVHPADGGVLYVGKTDNLTVRQRFVSNFQRKFHDLYARLGILKVDVIAAEIDLRCSARLTREWIDDLESLLIIRLQPPLNQSKKRSRGGTRPGTVVVCSGEWPLDQSRFIDRG